MAAAYPCRSRLGADGYYDLPREAQIAALVRMTLLRYDPWLRDWLKASENGIVNIRFMRYEDLSTPERRRSSTFWSGSAERWTVSYSLGTVNARTASTPSPISVAVWLAASETNCRCRLLASCVNLYHPTCARSTGRQK